MNSNILDLPRRSYPVSYDEPNAETREAIEEALSGKPLEELDLSRFDEYVAAL